MVHLRRAVEAFAEVGGDPAASGPRHLDAVGVLIEGGGRQGAATTNGCPTRNSRSGGAPIMHTGPYGPGLERHGTRDRSARAGLVGGAAGVDDPVGHHVGLGVDRGKRGLDFFPGVRLAHAGDPDGGRVASRVLERQCRHARVSGRRASRTCR